MKPFILMELVLFLSFGICYYGLSFTEIQTHENVHGQIQKYYGCTNSTIYYQFHWLSFSGNSTCHNYNDRTQETQNVEYNLHSMNDIAGYNITSITNTIFVCCFGIVLVISLFGFLILEKVEYQ